LCVCLCVFVCVCVCVRVYVCWGCFCESSGPKLAAQASKKRNFSSKWLLRSNVARRNFRIRVPAPNLSPLQNGDFLQYASLKMRRDPDVVLAAVQNKGYAMKYAGAELVEVQVQHIVYCNILQHTAEHCGALLIYTSIYSLNPVQ